MASNAAQVSIASNIVVEPNSTQTGETARINAAAPALSGWSGQSRRARSPVSAIEAAAKAGPISRAGNSAMPPKAQTRLISQNSNGGLCP